MNTNPRDPLHLPRSNQPQTMPQKNLPSETSMPNAPKSNIPDYGDKPEQARQAKNSVKSGKKIHYLRNKA